MNPVNVSAIIVTRGDVDLQPIIASLPERWEIIVWDNSGKVTECWGRPAGAHRLIAGGEIIQGVKQAPIPNLSVYGRYAAIEYATWDVIYIQDDDVIVADPDLLVHQWLTGADYDKTPSLKKIDKYKQKYTHDESVVVCNMPPEFRHDFYVGHALVGFGACFWRDLPKQVFDRFANYVWDGEEDSARLPDTEVFNRTCDIVFTALSNRVLVDIPISHMPYASDPNRMWKQSTHVGERKKMLELALRVRDEH